MPSFLRFVGKGSVCDGSGGFCCETGGASGSEVAVGGGTGIVSVTVSSGMTTWAHESYGPVPRVSGVLVSGGGYLSAIVVTFGAKVTVFLRLAVSRGVPGLAACRRALISAVTFFTTSARAWRVVA